MIDAQSIVNDWLEQHGKEYDGLVSDQWECACETDDLGPCAEGVQGNCEPGHKVEFPDRDCTNSGEDDCPAEGNCEWHMIPGARPAPAV